MASVVYEGSFGEASVAALCARAKVSARTFYAAFGSREACFMAAMDMVCERSCTIVVETLADAESWSGGIRTTLARMLLFFEAEPELARLSLVESRAAGLWALERREQHVATFTRTILESWGESAPAAPHPMTSTSVIAAVLAIVERHIHRGGGQPLITMLGSLVAVAVSPYLAASEVAEQVSLAEETVARLRAQHTRRAIEPEADSDAKLLETAPIVGNPRSHRARRCLVYLAGHPGASNREIARAIGISRDTQASTLLARLATAGLLLKRAARPGGANAWSLTGTGQIYASLLGKERNRV